MLMLMCILMCLCMHTVCVYYIYVCVHVVCNRKQETARDSWPGEESVFKANVL